MTDLAGRIIAVLTQAPEPLDDDEIAFRLGVVRQSVNQTCRRLAGRGEISRGPGRGGKVVNAVAGSAHAEAPQEPPEPVWVRSIPPYLARRWTGAPGEAASVRSGQEFEALARAVLTRTWGLALDSKVLTLRGGVTHSFDLVSPDARVVGDAKWFKDLKPIPAAKLSVISEYVWLLQQTQGADRRFLVFGQDRPVPDRWLARFRPLLDDVEFWFLGDSLARIA